MVRLLTETEKLKVLALLGWWLYNTDEAINIAKGILYLDEDGNIKNLQGETIATQKLIEKVKISIDGEEL